MGNGAKLETSYDCIVLGPLGSRHAMMTAYRHEDTVWIGTGCFLGTVEKFKAAVEANHKGNRHHAEYMAAISYVEAKFKIK